MHKTLRFKVIVLLAAAAAGAAYADSTSNKGVTTYRWVDEQGVVHYGDQIPPQYASKDRTVLNSQGVEVGHLDAQRTPEQQAADAQTRAEQMRQRQHDTFLITTYTSVADIEALRDVRLDQLRSQRAAAEQYLESLRTRLVSLQSTALRFQPYSARADARRMPDDLAETLVRTVNELHEQSAALTAQSQQVSELRAQFDADIERYRQLHTVHTN
jgi:Domain of unknown function (DUF4124)